jgi:hypothetical protein
VAQTRSLTFRTKKWVNDLLRRLTGYQFVKATRIDALEAAAEEARALRNRRR